MIVQEYMIGERMNLKPISEAEAEELLAVAH